MLQISDHETIAENARALKGRRRVSDAEIAAGTGLSRSAVNDRLNGKAKFQLEDLQAFATFFNVPLEHLLQSAAATAPP